MIDPKARSELSTALANLIEGRMTNDDFADLYSQRWDQSADPGVARIAEFGDSLYTEAMRYRLEDCHAVDDTTRKVAERCLLFLRTDLEYTWPASPSTGLECAVGGFTMFLLFPFGIVLLIAAAIMWAVDLLLIGLAVLGLC